MDLIIKMHVDDDEANRLSFRDLTEQCFLFFNAGFETSSSTSTFVSYSLALYDNIQVNLRSEIKSIMEKYGNEVTFYGMSEIKNLQIVEDGEICVNFNCFFTSLFPNRLIRNCENKQSGNGPHEKSERKL
jgi:hypothetical protein